MTEVGGSVQGPLASYNERYSPAGLLQRYARGRVRNFLHRQGFLVAGSLMLGFIISPFAGLVAFLLPLAGDALDVLCLRQVPVLLKRGRSLRRIRLLSTATSALHAATISASASIPFWLAGPPGDLGGAHVEPLFTIGVLAGAAINAGLVLPYHRLASGLRLAVYALVPAAIILAELSDLSGPAQVYRLHLGGLVMLYVSMAWFLGFSMRSFHTTRSHMLAQAEQRHELEEANARLVAQQQETRRLALVAERANDIMRVLDRQGRTLWANDAFTRVTGYTLGEARGRLLGELLVADSTSLADLEFLHRERAAGRPCRAEILNRGKDGRELWLETNQVPMFGPGGTVDSYIAVERDITAAKAHERQLEAARRAAEEGARVKTEFLANMSHEIRTPMNGVIGMAQLLADTPLNADQRLYAGTILSSAQALLSLINDVLDLSKLDAGEMMLCSTDFELRRCFEDTLRLLQPQAAAKGLSLDLDMPQDLPAELHGDDRRLRQILLNLAGNAIKFTETGGVRVSAAARNAPEGGILVEFEVADTGIGIPEDLLDKVFERFSQADAAISRRFGGTGLGLTISRRLADAMGGSITVTSEPGRGSCFRVLLPLRPARGAPAAAADHDRIPAAPARLQGLAGLKLLVAEDNQVNRFLLRKFLEDAPFELAFAVNGREAVERAESFAPDIVLMDMSMPVMDGLEAARAIRAMPVPQPVIIALTANAFDTDREACFAAGMDAFLSKPVNRDGLLAVLARHGRQGAETAS